MSVVGIFWDYENCAPSSNASGFQLIERIRQLSQQFGPVNLFKAYLQFPEKSSPKLHSLRSELQSCGVSLTDCPHNGKNSVDLMMIVDIMAFIKDTPAPATIILISGDRDFAYLLSTLRWRQYHVVLISNTFMTHESLSTQANVTFDWQSDVLKSRPYRPRRNISISNSTPGRPFDSDEPTLGSRRSSFAPLTGRRLSFTKPPTAVLEPAPELVPTVDVSKFPLKEESNRPESSASAHSDDWVLTNHSPSVNEKGLVVDTADDADEDTPLSPIFLSAQSSPELVPSDFEDDIPDSPGYLLLIGDSDDNVEPSPAGDTNNANENPDACMQGDSTEQQCDCSICIRSVSGSVSSDQEVQVAKEVVSVTLTNATTPPDEPELIRPITSSSPNSTKPGSSLNVLAPSFAPRLFSDTPVSQATAQPEFKDLVIVLNEMRANGISKPRFSIVAPVLLDRKPDVYQAAGVAQLKTYLQLAQNMGMVSLEQDKDGDGWMCLCHPWCDSSSSPEPLPSTPPHAQKATLAWKPSTNSIFHDLVLVLNELRLTGDPEPRFSTVAPRLLKRKAHVYELAGTTKFKEYIEAAVKAEIVATRGVRNGDGWVTLCEKWCSEPEKVETPRRAEELQPVETLSSLPVSSSSAFQSLVTVLEDLRAKRQEQPRISTIFSHLVWSGKPKIYELAGVATFKEYMNAAIAAGIIIVDGGDASNADASVLLCNSTPVLLEKPIPMVPSASAFDCLTSALDELRGSGMTELHFSEVAPVVLAKDPQAFTKVGVTTIGAYIRLARQAGLVPVRVTDGNEDGWVNLRSERSLVKPPSTPAPVPSLSNADLSPSRTPPPSVVTKIPSTFRDLVVVLQQLQSTTGETEARYANVVPLLLRKKPTAYQSVGVTKFKEYIALAVEAGIVTVRGVKNGDGWISLCPDRPGNVRNATRQSSIVTPSRTNRSPNESGPRMSPNNIAPMFKDLVWLLRQLRNSGDTEPLFSSIAPALLTNEMVRLRTLGAIGAIKFKPYAEAARDAGIVTIRCDRVGEERMSLCPAWQGGTFVPLELW